MNTTPAKATANQGQAKPPQRSFKVTYRPGDGAPVNTTWNGVRFTANVPVVLSLDNPRHFIEVPMPKVVETEDGTYATRTMTARVSMIESARGNHQFEVEGHKRAVLPVAAGHKPRTPEEYRGWAQAWFASAGTMDPDTTEEDEIQTSRQMLERWDDEEALRERIGVGEDDLAFLKPFFDMKVLELKRTMQTKHARNDGGADLTGGLE